MQKNVLARWSFRHKLSYPTKLEWTYHFQLKDQIANYTYFALSVDAHSKWFWIMSVGILTSINFGIQGHMITLVEVEGSHTLEEVYESLDIHVGQSLTVLVTLKALATTSQWLQPGLPNQYCPTAILCYQDSKNKTISPPSPLVILAISTGPKNK
ncbi:LOW QUALITY PROTEIN: hypothetical protein YC2023_103372 [Brassica napus]